MDKPIWPDYETESAAFRRAMGITRSPISSDEYLRRKPAPVIQPQRQRVPRPCTPLAPTPIKNDLGIHTPRWVVPLFILLFVGVVSALAMTLH